MLDKKRGLTGPLVSACMLVGLLSIAAPAAVASSGPSWYINCAVQHLGIYQLTNSPPSTQAKCNGTSGSTNVFAFELNYAGATFTVGSATSAQIFFAATAAGGISGTWLLRDMSTSQTISSGSFAGTASDTTGSCSTSNVVSAAGTANSGRVVTNGDAMRMTISYTATGGGVFSLCSGGSSPSSTDTMVGVTAAVPEFGAGAILPAALALLLLRLKLRPSSAR